MNRPDWIVDKLELTDKPDYPYCVTGHHDSPLDYEDCYCDFVPVTELSWEIQEILIDTLEQALGA